MVFATLLEIRTKLNNGKIVYVIGLIFLRFVFFQGIPEKKQNVIIDDIKNRLRPSLFYKGKWIADYKIIIIMAFKEGKDHK
ncbi:MAG: hypothetical protein O4861_15105 [Trichodesmium sp. St16_bin4-tuft]|nr:hypothetical protein [Trichodesmium sp. MAG_R01]MDE5068250.1 hypothetical protein [Trichodesmium sp. St4_bin8_1]MDE5072477.1 hypothetical protein [Trichodesmium sp. St5_bin8]MDE5092028.1 hypothetical protein [Trichodesmium sp. St18_bin3_1_1]MDE5099582.1 hypothetical protein [Trichodesmium sp. St16_bin4-tuft]